MDNLTNCPCGKSDACYSQPVENTDITNYTCLGCGFLSNTLMVSGSEFLEEQYKLLPELYKELLWQDESGKIWMPATVTLPSQGMIFMEGDKENFHWSAVLAVPIKEEEKHKFPIPGKKNCYYSFKMDMGTIKKFDKYNYIDALEYIGVLPSETKETGSIQNK